KEEGPLEPELTMLEGHKTITLSVCPTTGGNFELEIGSDDSIEGLRRKIARHLQTPRERLTILFKEKVLSNGTLLDHRIQDGNKITLLPTVESGFSSTVQGTQQSIIQAIESLSDVQIDDFLSGRSPLTLALRVGDHMMFVQLQLEQSMRSSRHHRHRPPQTPGFPRPYSPDPTTSLNCLPPRYAIYIAEPGYKVFVVSAPTLSPTAVVRRQSFVDIESNASPTTYRISGFNILCYVINPIVSAQNYGKERPRSSASSPTVAPPAGACIDSFTTHGPGIFSGTFSGSLHPNIQDTDGRPKRDPQTILQILTDLLSATNHYQVRRNRDSNLFRRLCANCWHASHHNVPPPLTPTRTPSRTTHDVISRPAVNRLKQLLQENNTTRSKLQQLTHMMKQRKLRRKMRREACGPY
uniref:Ubiquitin-like domain-containing protein n=1 Tax=Ciona savignyi TaxID=51511 RepID=H2YCM3_CIOSA